EKQEALSLDPKTDSADPTWTEELIHENPCEPELDDLDDSSHAEVELSECRGPEDCDTSLDDNSPDLFHEYTDEESSQLYGEHSYNEDPDFPDVLEGSFEPNEPPGEFASDTDPADLQCDPPTSPPSEIGDYEKQISDSPSCPDRSIDVDKDWPEPLPYADAAPLPLPKELLPGAAGQFVRSLAEATETPAELATIAVLGVLSCAISGKVAVEAEAGYLEPCHLFLCGAAESGSRKTAVVNAATAPLAAWEKKERERLEPEIRRARSERKMSEAVVEKMRRASVETDIEENGA